MNIEIRCFATLAPFAPPEGIVRDVPEDADIATLMNMLRIPPDEVKILFINGVQAEPTSRLTNGDRVGLFPAVGGG